MPELIRSIVNRLRAFVGERRRAPRYAMHLEAGLALSISVSGAKTGAQKAGQTLRLAGYTRDISATGLALIVPSIRIGGNYITTENRTLQIILKLPSGTVEIHGKPVRYSPLEEDATDTGYLVGVQIERMSDEDSKRFNAFIEEMGQKESRRKVKG